MKERLLLMGLGGLSWEALADAIARGLAPNLARFAARGASGRLRWQAGMSDMAAWATIASGQPPQVHQILDEQEAWAGGLRPTTRAAWRASPIWHRAAEAGLSTAGIGWPASAPGASWAGAHIDDRFAPATGRGWEDWALPRDCAPAALREGLRGLRVHPTDIEGAALTPFVRDIDAIDQERDPSLVALAIALAQAATIQAGAAHLLEKQTSDLVVVHHPWLATVRRRLGSKAAPAPYAGTADVAWRFVDALAGRVIELAGEDCLVMIVAPGWRSDPGVLLGAGPSVAAGGRIEGANALDIAPTILARFGLCDGMLPGKVLPSLASPGDRTLPPAERLCFAPPDRALLATVSALGYAPPPPQRSWYARHHAALGRAVLPIFPEHAADHARAAMEADGACLEALLLTASVRVVRAEAEPLPALADAIERAAPLLPWAGLVRGGYHALRGEAALAQPFLRAAETAPDIDAPLRAGGAWMMLERPADAARAFAAALAIDPGNPAALLGASAAASAANRLIDAELPLRDLLARDPGHALAWEQLAAILRRQGRRAEAARAEQSLQACR